LFFLERFLPPRICHISLEERSFRGCFSSILHNSGPVSCMWSVKWF
jgi:hypothetical protein